MKETGKGGREFSSVYLEKNAIRSAWESCQTPAARWWVDDTICACKWAFIGFIWGVRWQRRERVAKG